MPSFNLRRDHRSLATMPSWRIMGVPKRFQSQARPPLPCHNVRRNYVASMLLVSISGETTAPLPPGFNNMVIAIWKVSISGETTAPLPHLRPDRPAQFHAVSISGETTAPLPLRTRSRPIWRVSVSISGETTAPLPPHVNGCSEMLKIGFNLRRDHRSLATEAGDESA